MDGGNLTSPPSPDEELQAVNDHSERENQSSPGMNHQIDYLMPNGQRVCVCMYAMLNGFNRLNM